MVTFSYPADKIVSDKPTTNLKQQIYINISKLTQWECEQFPSLSKDGFILLCLHATALNTYILRPVLKNSMATNAISSAVISNALYSRPVICKSSTNGWNITQDAAPSITISSPHILESLVVRKSYQ